MRYPFKMLFHAMTTPNEVTITTIYLELPSRAHFRPVHNEHAELAVVQAHVPLPSFYRFLYTSVGNDYSWIDRLDWTDAELQEYLAQPTISLLVLYVRGTPAGYVELDASSHEPGTEIAYFGIIPAFHGCGLGKHLLSVGVQRAYDDGAKRVWLHTCSLDGPYALANYMARGFVPYRTTTHQQSVY